MDQEKIAIITNTDETPIKSVFTNIVVESAGEKKTVLIGFKYIRLESSALQKQ
jgi:hypothetical protein